MGEKFIVENEGIYNFSRCLYDAACNHCGKSLNWEAAFDADGTMYHADCCGIAYSFVEHTVRVTFEEKGA